MVRTPEERMEVSRQIEQYKLSAGTFGFEMAINDRTVKIPGIF